MKRPITAFTLLLFILLSANGARKTAAKPPRKARGPEGRAPQVEPLPLLEVIAHTEMKTSAEHQEAYAAALAKAAQDSFYPLHAVRRDYQEKLEDGTAAYRLEIVHKGEIIIGKPISAGRGPLSDLMDKRGRGIQDNAGYEVGWTYWIDQNGAIQYRLLKWEGKDGGYKELMSWQTRQTNRTVFYAAKAFIMKTAPPAGVQMADGAKIIVGSGIPALPLTPAELAAEKKAAAESILPVGTKREILTALCPCTLLNASAAKRDIRGKRIGPGTDSVRVRVINKSPWTISEMQVQVSFAQDGRGYRAFLDGGSLEPGQSRVLEPSRPLDPGGITPMAERNLPPRPPITEVAVIKFELP
jgi:hypothetical protein